MIPDTYNSRPFRSSMFPVGRALVETRVSLNWRLFQGWRPSQKNRRTARIENGTRMAIAMLKRLHAREGM
jgi:hypothetical protein